MPDTGRGQFFHRPEYAFEAAAEVALQAKRPSSALLQVYQVYQAVVSQQKGPCIHKEAWAKTHSSLPSAGINQIRF